MLNGAIIAGVLWVIYVLWALLTLKPYETLRPGAALFVLVFLEVVGICAGYCISTIWSYFNA